MISITCSMLLVDKGREPEFEPEREVQEAEDPELMHLWQAR